MYGGTLINLSLLKCNSTFTGAVTEDGQTQAPVEVGQFAAVHPDYPNILLVQGFAGYSTAIFTVDTENKTVSAKDQCEVPVRLNDGTSDKVWATSVEPAEGATEFDYTLNGTITGIDDKSCVVNFPLWYLANWKFGMLEAYLNSQMTLPFNLLAGSGVEGVVAEKENNAPVEYFNLQGVRVMNPEAGQLVIKRQGSEVKKMVIR